MAALGKAEIAALIPHAGSMVLLDSVVEWNGERIRCSASSHRASGNPLRRRDTLPVLAGIEYAAQAMALHGALNAGTPGQRKVLGTVRDVQAGIDRLDRVGADLLIQVRLLGEASVGAQYAFEVVGEAQELLRGTATVFNL